MVLFIGASIVPIISGTTQNLDVLKNPGKKGDQPNQKVQHDQQTHLEKSHTTDTKVKQQSEKTTPDKVNLKNTKQVTIKEKHVSTLPSFTPDNTISQTTSNRPKPLGDPVHNLNTGENFTTIQAAINDLETLNGHTIVVDQGIYQENVIVNKSLTIRGNNATSMPVIDGMLGDGFNITANSVTLRWLNFTNATTAIYCSASGFSLINNTFYYDTNGLVWRIYNTNLAANQNILTSTVEYNTFYSNSILANKDMIYIGLGLFYQNNSGYTVSIGDITLNRNTFYLNGTTDTDAIFFDYIYLYYLYGGTVSIGNIDISYNTIYGAYDGLDFYGEIYQIKNVQLTIGDFIVTHNLIMNQGVDGIIINYFDGEDWSGTTQAVFGTLQITNNTIQSTQINSYGIEVSDYGYWYNYSGTTSLEVGNMIIEDNSVDVNYEGILFELYYVGSSGDPLEDYASVSLGDFLIHHNTVNTASDSAIYIDFEDCGTYMYDHSVCTVGAFRVTENTITGTDDGIYVDYFYDIGYEMYDYSVFTMGDIEFTQNDINVSSIGIYVYDIEDNGYDMYNSSKVSLSDISFSDNMIISSADEGIYVEYFEYIGEDLYGNALFTMGSIQFNDNIVASYYDGIYIDYIYEFGYDMYDNTKFTMTNIEVNNNNITSSDDYGIYVYDIDYFGYYMYDNTIFTMGDIQFNDNVIDAYDTGIYVDYVENLGEEMEDSSSFSMGSITLTNNTITSSDDEGIYTEIEYLGYDLYDNAEFSMGDILIKDNIVDSYNGGIDISYIYELGVYMYDDATFAMGDIVCNNNTVTSNYGDGIYTDIEYIGYDMNENTVCTVGDILFNSNTITTANDDGLYFEYIYGIGYELYDYAQFSMGDIQANFNTIIAGDGYGIYIEWYEYAYYLGETETDECIFQMGDMTCCYNNITSYYEGIYTEDIDDIGYEMYGSSTCTIGDILFNHNTINSTDDSGLYLYDPEYFGYDMYDQSEFTMGNLEANDNTIYAGNGYGIYLYYDEFGYYMGEDSTDACIFTMGNITVNNNTIVNSGDDGIYTEEFDYFGYEMYGSSMFTMGNIQFNHNTVTTSGLGNYGFYLDYFGDFGEELNDNSQVVMGNIEFNDNVVNSTDGEGMYFDIYDIGYDMYDNSTFAMGSIQVNRNVITSDSYGIDMYWIGDIGEYLEDYAQASMRNIETNDNIVTNTNDYGMYLDVGDIGYDLTGHSSFFVNNIIFINNTVTSGQDGINVDTTDWINEEIYDDAQFYGRGPYLAFNTINATNIGILVSDSSEVIVACNTVLTADIGIEVNDICDNITIAYHTLNGTGNDGVLVDQSDYNTILGNSINASINKNGITLTDSNNNLISRNTISNNTDTGINVTVSTNNMIYHNNILNNTLQAFDDSNASNTWDNGYPSGGNYWSDYTGIDDDGDGIGETPYNITGYTPNDQDRYPLTDRVVINHPSLYTPSNPSPANGATGVSIYSDTIWSGGDPDNDYNNYDIYFGTTNPPAYYDTVYFIQGSPIGYEQATLALDTTYYWQIVAWDCFGDSVSGPVWSFDTGVHAEFQPPPPVYHYAPTADPDGPYTGLINVPVQFDGTGSHTNFGEEGGTIVQYDWGFYAGDTLHDLGPTPTHTYTTAGIYNVTLRVLDSKDGIGVGQTTVTIKATNNPPATPTIAGTTSGNVNTDYSYTVTATDPDNNNIRYTIDWGDGTAKTTSSFGASGLSYTASHTWATTGFYTIKVNAEDDNNALSGTATLQVTIGTPPTPPPVHGYLVDTNGDGIPDSFHNNDTGQTTKAEKQADGTYLIDVNGDGTWDYVYNPVTGTYAPAPTEGFNWPLWGGVGVIVIIIIIGGVLIIMRRRKK